MEGDLGERVNVVRKECGRVLMLGAKRRCNFWVEVWLDWWEDFVLVCLVE